MYSDMDLFYILQSYVPPPYLLLYIIQGKINDQELFILTESVIRKCNIRKFAYANNGLSFIQSFKYSQLPVVWIQAYVVELQSHFEKVQYKKLGVVVYKGLERGTAVEWRVGGQGAAETSVIMYSSGKMNNK